MTKSEENGSFKFKVTFIEFIAKLISVIDPSCCKADINSDTPCKTVKDTKKQVTNMGRRVLRGRRKLRVSHIFGRTRLSLNIFN